VLGQLLTALNSLASVADEASAYAFIGGLCAVTGGILVRLGSLAEPYADSVFDIICNKLMASDVMCDTDARTEVYTCLQTLIEGTFDLLVH